MDKIRQYEGSRKNIIQIILSIFTFIQTFGKTKYQIQSYITFNMDDFQIQRTLVPEHSLRLVIRNLYKNLQHFIFFIPFFLNSFL